MILVAGTYNTNDFGLVRYNADGSVETGFGTNGRVTTDFFLATDRAYALAVQSDGKIVVAGAINNSTGTHFGLARYNSDGSLDSGLAGDTSSGDAFGNFGKVVTDFAGLSDEALAVAIAPGDQIVAAGYATVLMPDAPEIGRPIFAAARYNVDGSLDMSFDGDGKATIDFGSTAGKQYAQALVSYNDGRVLLGGRTFCGGSTTSVYDFALARLGAGGALDPSFDTDGRVLTDFGSSSGTTVYDSCYSLVLQPDEKILAAGDTDYGGLGNKDFALARYNDNGSLDSGLPGDATPGDSFGTEGKVVTPFGGAGADTAYAVALQLDEGGSLSKIVAAGTGVAGGNGGTGAEFAVARYNVNGTLDTTFGTGGKLTTDFARGFDEARGMAVLPDGKVVAAGYSNTSGGSNAFALARYQPDNKATVVAPIDPYADVLGGVTATVVSTSRIDLRWAPSPVSNATYNVYRGSESDFRPDPGNRIASGVITHSYSDTTVAAGSRYYYLVTAVTLGGESLESDVTTQVAGSDAQPTQLSAATVDESSVELTWADKSSNETGFVVERSDDGQTWVTVQTLGRDATGTMVTDLSPQTTYTFRVSANFPGTQPAQTSGPTTTGTTGRVGQYRGLVVAIQGHKHGWNANPNSSGVSDLIIRLRQRGFRVWQGVEFIFAGFNVKHDGTGPLFDRVVNRLQQGDIFNVAVFGYSHGADLARKMVNRLGDIHDSTGALWAVTYSAYIEAIQRGPIDLWYPAFAQRNRPFFGECNCNWHENFYQFEPFGLSNPLRGNSLTSTPGANY